MNSVGHLEETSIMTEQNKQLLLKDLCARLPYGVICRYTTAIPLLGEVLNYGPLQEIRRKGEYFTVNGADCLYEDIKPYLRTMSSMSEEEENEYRAINCYEGLFPRNEDAIDYALEHHLDISNLIEKGLALEAPEGMYKTE